MKYFQQVGLPDPKWLEKFELIKGDVLITKDSESQDDIAIPSYVVKNLDGTPVYLSDKCPATATNRRHIE